MEKQKINYLVKYFSVAFVGSYMFFHNIFLVFIGMILALYDIYNNGNNKIINKAKVNNINSINNKLETINPTKISNKDRSKVESNLSLVETVEKYGFIPSSNDNDCNVA